MGFEALQTKALDYIRFVLSDMNVVTELGSPLLARLANHSSLYALSTEVVKGTLQSWIQCSIPCFDISIPLLLEARFLNCSRGSLTGSSAMVQTFSKRCMRRYWPSITHNWTLCLQTFRWTPLMRDFCLMSKRPFPTTLRRPTQVNRYSSSLDRRLDLP